jgi:hypothetical protein
MPDNKVTIFRPSTKQKETGSGIAQEPDYAMVETGESGILRLIGKLSVIPRRLTIHLFVQ